jgi:hypothetical protein
MRPVMVKDRHGPHVVCEQLEVTPPGQPHTVGVAFEIRMERERASNEAAKHAEYQHPEEAEAKQVAADAEANTLAQQHKVRDQKMAGLIADKRGRAVALAGTKQSPLA